MKYRKKPVVIEAFQYNGDLNNAPDWAKREYEKGVLFHNYFNTGLFVCTLEGDHHVSVGDFIIKGVQGKLYPCKPDIFEQTYELVEETSQEA